MTETGDLAAPDAAAQRIADAGRREVAARLRAAFTDELGAPDAPTVDPDALDQLVTDAGARAGAALWRRALAEAATAELGIGLADAVGHPAVVRAQELVGAPAYEVPSPAVEASPPPVEVPSPAVEASPPPVDVPAQVESSPEPEPAAEPEAPEGPAPEDDGDAVRLVAVHRAGIKSLKAGERDIELRVTTGGLDVLKRSSGATIGRLEWAEVTQVELVRPRRGLRRRAGELHVVTDRGRASFELPGVTDAQLQEHLEPLLARRGGAGS